MRGPGVVHRNGVMAMGCERLQSIDPKPNRFLVGLLPDLLSSPLQMGPKEGGLLSNLGCSVDESGGKCWWITSMGAKLQEMKG